MPGERGGAEAAVQAGQGTKDEKEGGISHTGEGTYAHGWMRGWGWMEGTQAIIYLQRGWGETTRGYEAELHLAVEGAEREWRLGTEAMHLAAAPPSPSRKPEFT